MNGGEVSGYNKGKIEALAEKINSTAQQAGEGIKEELENGIITPMSDKWYAPEAVEFFESFKSTVAQSGAVITEVFDTFRQAVQDAGTNWAENTKGEAPTLSPVNTVEIELNISAIQAINGAGDVSLDESGATSVAGTLGEIEQNIKTRLENLAQGLADGTEFLGHGQAEKVSECFVKVSGEVHKIFKFLTEGDSSLQSCLNKFVTKYQQVSEGVSNSFTATGE